MALNSSWYFNDLINFVAPIIANNPENGFDLKLSIWLDPTEMLEKTYKRWKTSINDGQNLTRENQVRHLLELWKETVGGSKATYGELVRLTAGKEFPISIVEDIQNHLACITNEMSFQEPRQKNNLNARRRNYYQTKVGQTKNDENHLSEQGDNLEDNEFAELMKMEEDYKEFLIFKRFKEAGESFENGMIEDNIIDTEIQQFRSYVISQKQGNYNKKLPRELPPLPNESVAADMNNKSQADAMLETPSDFNSKKLYETNILHYLQNLLIQIYLIIRTFWKIK